MARLTKKQQAAKALADAKLRETTSGIRPKMLAPGITGSKITGVKRWG